MTQVAATDAQRLAADEATKRREAEAAQRRAEEAEVKLLEAKGEAARAGSVADDLQKQLRRTGQPQHYLAEQIERTEAQKLEAEGQVAALRKALAEQTDALATARRENTQLLADLESLLSQRGSLDALRMTLTRLLPAEMAPALAPSA